MSDKRKAFKESDGWLCQVEERQEPWTNEWAEFKKLRLIRLPFSVTGQVHKRGEGAHYRCEGKDTRGQAKTWDIPCGMKADEIASTLASSCAPIGSFEGVGKALLVYMRDKVANGAARAIEATDRMGWFTPPGFEPGDPLEPSFFVFPDGEVIGPTGCEAERPELLEPPSFRASFNVKGEVRDWVREVAPFIRGQRKGLLALSMAVFASVARRIPGATGFSLILTGASSNGKTSWLLAAESFACKPGAGQFSFNSTGNALEANVRQRRDVVSAIDEMTVATADLVGRLGYMANGAGRARADKTGAAREVENFFPVILGTSEASASAKLSEMGKQTTGGQEARLLCPDSDAGEKLGAFSTLDECGASELERWRALSPKERLDDTNRKTWGAEFSKALKAAVQRSYGAPLRAWVQWSADNAAELQERITEEIEAFKAELGAVSSCRFEGKSLSAVGHRVSDRFALLYACLAIANDALQLGLGERAAILESFVEECLSYADKQRFFDGSVEAVKYLDKLEEALSKFGNTRFQEIRKDASTGEEHFSEEPRQEFWGYLDKRDAKEPLFLINQATFKSSLCFGMDERAAFNALAGEDLLKHEGECFASGTPRYTLRKTVKGARARFVALHASPVSGLRKKDEEPPLKLVPSDASDNLLRKEVIDQNGGL